MSTEGTPQIHRRNRSETQEEQLIRDPHLKTQMCMFFLFFKLYIYVYMCDSPHGRTTPCTAPISRRSST